MADHDLSYYVKCMIGGAMACGLTHAGITPVDLVKCRKQVYPEEYKSILGGLKKIKATGGLSELSLGFGPTIVGYSL
jgi:solute carrier family 25 phosphate transporter 3